VDAQSLLNRIIDAVKDKSAMRRQTALRKTRRARGQQDAEWIILIDVHAGLRRALTVAKSAVAKIGDDNRLQEIKILRRLRSFQLFDTFLLKNEQGRLEKRDN
jgi:hypothetical protein